MVADNRRHALLIELVLLPVGTQVLAIIDLGLIVFIIDNSIAEANQDERAHDPSAPLVNCSSNSGQGLLHGLTPVAEHIQEANGEEPEENPNSTRHKH